MHIKGVELLIGLFCGAKKARLADHLEAIVEGALADSVAGVPRSSSGSVALLRACVRPVSNVVAGINSVVNQEVSESIAKRPESISTQSAHNTELQRDSPVLVHLDVLAQR